MSAQQDGTVVLDEDWEEWDGRSPFWAHCVAGSLAGVAEHAAIYPLDTVRTHIQGMYAAMDSASFCWIDLNSRMICLPFLLIL